MVSLGYYMLGFTLLLSIFLLGLLDILVVRNLNSGEMGTGLPLDGNHLNSA